MSRKRSSRKSSSQQLLPQTKLDASFNEDARQDLDEQANDLVRYVIYRAGEHAIIRRNDLLKTVLPKSGRNLEQIVEKATTVLKNVYGYNLLMLDHSAATAARAYVVTNSLAYKRDPNVDEEEVPTDVNKIVLMLVLTQIFMSNSVVSENSLYSFLKSLGIDVEVRHAIFGNVKEYITNTLTKQRYVNVEVDNVSKKLCFSWGLRAEREVSKMELLKFVCRMYKDRLPKSWTNHFQLASAQDIDNELMDDAN